MWLYMYTPHDLLVHRAKPVVQYNFPSGDCGILCHGQYLVCLVLYYWFIVLDHNPFASALCLLCINAVAFRCSGGCVLCEPQNSSRQSTELRYKITIFVLQDSLTDL